VDLRLDPEPEGIFAAIRHLKDDLDVNIELASPADFLPELPGWRGRSRFIAKHEQVEFYHYDFYSQALAKVERGHAQDRRDVDAMIRLGLIRVSELATLFDAVEHELERFPSIDADGLRARVEDLLQRAGGGPDE
jgi:hypothetical protein